MDPQDRPRDPYLEVDEGDEDDEEIEGLHHDAPSAVRLSPYAVGSFVLGALSLWTFRVSFVALGLRPSTLAEAADTAAPLIVALVLAGLGYWASLLAEEELLASEGRLGGAGFARLGRYASMATIGLVVVAVLVLLFLPRATDQFGPFSTGP